jgi:hypothetical protein
MSLENFKTYLSNRPYITQDYSDEELTKILNFAKNLLTLFFKIDDEFLSSSEFEFPLFEEAIYLLQNDPTSEYLTKYEGLTSFNVAGAISATVAEEYLPYIGKLAKFYLEKFGYGLEIADKSKVSYGYTMF